jgi:hypothetical protein
LCPKKKIHFVVMDTLLIILSLGTRISSSTDGKISQRTCAGTDRKKKIERREFGETFTTRLVFYVRDKMGR